MKILQQHASFVEFKPCRKEARLAEEAKPKKFTLENVLVLFTCVERQDNQAIAKKAVEETKEFLRKLKLNRILLYPYAHLSKELADEAQALEILKLMEKLAKKEGIQVFRAPFGWAKEYRIEVKGHPLAEQFRSYQKEEKPKEKRIKKKYLLLLPNGKTVDPKNYEFRKSEQDLKILVERSFGQGAAGRRARVHQAS